MTGLCPIAAAITSISYEVASRRICYYCHKTLRKSRGGHRNSLHEEPIVNYSIDQKSTDQNQ